MTDAGFWDAEAASFDDEPDHGLRDPATRAAWAELLGRLLPPAPARVADLGCGTGSLSALLAEAGHRVRGLDLSPAMVAAARTKTAGLDVGLVVGDATRPPWASGTLDVVLTRHVLWAVPDADAALAAWIDLLAPGGRLVLVEGRWWTGAGMPAADVVERVGRHRLEVELVPLDDPVLWGGPIQDERFAVVSRR